MTTLKHKIFGIEQGKKMCEFIQELGDKFYGIEMVNGEYKVYYLEEYNIHPSDF